MAKKSTMLKRNEMASNAIKGLQSTDKNERYEAYKTAVKLCNEIQQSITKATTPLQEVQIPFVIVALNQILRGLMTAYGEYSLWADYIQSQLDVKTVVNPKDKGGTP